MFRRFTKATTACALIMSLFGCAPMKPPPALNVSFGDPVYYANDEGERFTAEYGSSPDGTGQFARVTLPDGRQFILPVAVSGSGARYTDDREIVWWTHQGTVRVDMKDARGEWYTRYPELREVEGPPGPSALPATAADPQSSE